MMSGSVRTRPGSGSGPTPDRILWQPSVIGLIRQAGYTKIAATIRRIKYDTALFLSNSS